MLWQGIVPACLLDEYLMWQNADGSITGYQPPKVRKDMTKANAHLSGLARFTSIG